MHTLTAQQQAALAELHKQLDALAALEGKGGPSVAPLIVQVNAALIALYRQILGIGAAK